MTTEGLGDHAAGREEGNWPVQRYARLTGVLMLLTLIFGGYGEGYVPSNFIVGTNAAATAQRIIASEFIFRLGFAAYLVEAVCDVALALLFYVLLRRVDKNLALLSAFFALMATATYAVSEMFYFTALTILRGGASLAAFSPEQLQALALLALKIFNNSAGIFLGFYGIETMLRGALVFRSGYLPKLFGVLMLVAGGCFVIQNLAFVLAPKRVSTFLLLPMVVAMFPFAIWLLVRGVDLERWNDAGRRRTAIQA